jgi:putative ABC transport system substrate-binding protein
VASLAEQLRALGYVEGKNLAIESRWTEGKNDTLPQLAAELVGLKVDVIVTLQTPSTLAAKRATSTIPIVMAPSGDPVATGLVASLARPGGNVTGMSGAVQELAAKTLELLKEMIPATKRVGIVANGDDSFTPAFLERVELASRKLGIALVTHTVRGGEQLDAAFDALARTRVSSVLVQPSLPQRRAVELALKHRLPAGAAGQLFSDAGGLLSYAGNRPELLQVVALYVDKILKGAKPADLPVQQPTKFDITVNLKMARQIGLTIPPAFLARADKVIE